MEEMNLYSKEINAPFILEQNYNNPPYYGQTRWIAWCVNLQGDPGIWLCGVPNRIRCILFIRILSPLQKSTLICRLNLIPVMLNG